MKAALLATQSACHLCKGIVLVLVLGIALSGCQQATVGTGEQVKLVITPVATPTSIPAALPTSAPVTYVVKSGDTLSGIADLFGVTVDDIIRVNNIADPNSLQLGQVLTIPGRQAGPTPTQTVGAAPVLSGTQTLAPGKTAGPAASPTFLPPDVTPPLGPTVPEPAAGSPVVPSPIISPTKSP
ncbi:MAG: LysM peptidoglycan-binding domain-containing protein [Chloroflexota bacterium]|nr:LysM peptidoglycan-binding domain-containing protein [Chloroflexota bacterium]